MFRDDITCLIFSCDKFSDLWDGNLLLFRENWPGREFPTYIVTDRPTSRSFPDVEVIAAGEDAEWSERLKFAMGYVKTPYVFVTLDDYFLTGKADTAAMERYLELMKRDGYDYFRFFKRPKRATREPLEGFDGVYHVDPASNYSVNLYPGIWAREFLETVVKEPRNAWMFEISLSDQAVEYGAKCLCSYNKEYPMLDVVRKGKILHSANRWFRRHPGVYNGDREVQSWWFEAKLQLKMFVGRHAPMCLVAPLRKVFVKAGGVSFVDAYKKEKGE